ncbi:MAG: M48 family metalloprotease, partial [Acidobacteriota bacterium]
AASPVVAQPAAHRDGPIEIVDTKLYEKSAKAAQAALAYYGEVDDPEQKRRLLDIGYRVAARARTDMPFSFYLIEMPVPNAFALPGGHVFVTRGMLDLGLTDDMLANLLGHEIAHVVHEHGTRMQRRATLLNILSQAALLGVMIGAEGGPENPQDPLGIERSGSRKGSLVQGTAAAGVVFTELLLRKFSRGFEDEADLEGQRMAATAGFDPDGARALWQLMTDRLPTANEYGYWRTHPFSDKRLRAAEVRGRDLKIQDPERPDFIRRATQAAILAYAETLDEDDRTHRPFGERSAPRDPRDRRPEETAPPPIEREVIEPWDVGYGAFLERSALDAWPLGEAADTVRLSELHGLRDRELERHEVGRDYGAVLRAYERQLAEVRELTPDSPLVATLEAEAAELREARATLYPKALGVWDDGFYQTPFLKTFLSNYPDAEPAADVALALGNAYSRMRRQSDAVEHFLRAMEAGEGSDAGRRALSGLRNLAPYLDELSALQRLAETSADDELRQLAAARLAERVTQFETLENGAEFLRHFPTSEHAAVVGKRIETLAQNLYGEVVLYQELGDPVKALERIQQILEHAPLTPAADALRERAVLEAS